MNQSLSPDSGLTPFQKQKAAFMKRQAARGRLPMWLMLLAPLTFLSLTFGITIPIVFWADHFHHFFHPQLSTFVTGPRNSPLGWVPILIMFPPFLIGVSMATLFGNLLFWIIPPIRRAMNKNTEGEQGASFADAMRASRNMLLFVAIPCALLTGLGVWAPWDR